MIDASLWRLRRSYVVIYCIYKSNTILFCFVCCFEVTEEVRIYFRCVGRNCSSSSTTTAALTLKVQKCLVDEHN